MKILVTGGAGFIGTNLIKRLLLEGHTVVSIDNYSTGLPTNHQAGCEYVNADICSIADYSVFGKVDLIYHLAAIARIQPSFERPEDYFRTNASATMTICKYCADTNTPLVYAGSSSHHSGKFKNPYTFSKDVGEEIIQLFQQHYNLHATIARFYNVYGPHHLKKGGYCTLIGTWESCLDENKPLTIYGNGSKRRDFTHVNDIVDGLVLIHSKQAWGYVFEFGKGKNYSIKDIADAFESNIIYKEDRPGEADVTLCNSTLASSVLGWMPKEDIINYIKQYLNAKRR